MRERRRRLVAGAAGLGVLLVAASGCRTPPDAAPAVVVPAPEPAAVEVVEPEESEESVAVDPPESPAAAEGCRPLEDLQYRQEGDLVVPARPQGQQDGGGRFRNQRDGSLQAGARREWIGPPVPAFVPLHEGTTELFLLDRVEEDFVAVYRDPYEASSCTIRSRTNCDFHAKAFDPCGEPLWSVELNRFFSRPDHLEIGDIRFHEGVLFFSEACQTYSKEAKRRCSALVAIDPVAGEEKWRTRNLVSNNRLMLYRDFIVTIYSFSGEPSRLHVVRIDDGKVVLKHPIEKGAWDLRIHDDGHLQTAAFGDRHHHWEMIGWDTDEPRLRRVRD